MFNSPSLCLKKIWENTGSLVAGCLPCLCHPVPLNTFFSSRRWVWLRSTTHFLRSSSSDRLDASRLTSDPAGSGGLWVVRKGFSLRCCGSTDMISFGQGAVSTGGNIYTLLIQRLVLLCTHNQMFNHVRKCMQLYHTVNHGAWRVILFHQFKSRKRQI